MTPRFQTAADLLRGWIDDLKRGEPPPRFAVGPPFDSVDLRPGRLVLLGGAPGAGKSAALLQMAVDLLRLNPAVRVLLANVEMAPSLLLERIVARAARVRLTALADRTWNADQLDRVQLAMGSLEGVASRLGFLGPPFSLQHLAAAADDFGAGVLVVDYIQRFVSDGGDKGKREALEDAASILRRLCDLGACVLCAAAVSRQKGRTGSNYASLGLASFRGSSELEYGADSAYLAIPDDLGGVRFENPKQRYGKPTDIQTVFDSDLMTFSAAPSGLAGFDAVPLSKDNH